MMNPSSHPLRHSPPPSYSMPLSPDRFRMRQPRLILGLLVAVTSAGVGGCATTSDRAFVWAQDLPPAAEEGPGAIHARDTLSVVVMDQPSMSGEFVVHDDGTYMQ